MGIFIGLFLCFVANCFTTHNWLVGYLIRFHSLPFEVFEVAVTKQQLTIIVEATFSDFEGKFEVELVVKH